MSSVEPAIKQCSILGAVHSFESFGSVDGPGVRFIIFLQGCCLRCAYCHNPDTWKSEAGSMKAEDVLAKALRYRSYWGNEGGITVSGGEPLLQIDFLNHLFTLSKKESINTCIDTSGAPFDSTNKNFFKKFNELMSVTDLLLVDLKHIVDEDHIKLTGKSNKSTISMLRYLDYINKPVWIRHVLIPGMTDSIDHLKKMRSFIDELSNVEKVEVLPYHTLGVSKYETLGLLYKLKDINPPTKENIALAKQILAAN